MNSHIAPYRITGERINTAVDFRIAINHDLFTSVTAGNGRN
jgi:hypothetical protein